MLTEFDPRAFGEGRQSRGAVARFCGTHDGWSCTRASPSGDSGNRGHRHNQDYSVRGGGASTLTPSHLQPPARLPQPDWKPKEARTTCIQPPGAGADKEGEGTPPGTVREG